MIINIDKVEYIVGIDNLIYWFNFNELIYNTLDKSLRNDIVRINTYILDKDKCGSRTDIINLILDDNQIISIPLKDQTCKIDVVIKNRDTINYNLIDLIYNKLGV
jgi:hypothetical protein